MRARVFNDFPEFTKLPLAQKEDSIHLVQSIAWLAHAQDASSTGGVCAYFDLAQKKWGAPYRETTGYIIETFLNYFKTTGDHEYLDRATRMGDWELDVQCDDGAWGEVRADGTVGKKIFNTGQVMIGLATLYKETNDERYLSALKKAGDWLVANQESDGRWERYSTQGARTYDARVAWPLLSLYDITKEEKYKHAAETSVAWILSTQQLNFWFDKTSLSEDNRPWTHLIAYTISGLLESYVLLGSSDKKLFDSFYGAASVLLDYYETHTDTYLPCSFNEGWQSPDNYSCLTGDAQLAIIWMQIYLLTKEERFLAGADRMIADLKSLHITDSLHAQINGGIAGSYPIDGAYAPFQMLNWATKFFADALLLRERIST